MKNRKGQATTELVIILPLFCVLAGGAISVVYMTWQGLKTQQAANLAARMQGQERVNGGVNRTQVDGVNGFGINQNGMQDIDPMQNNSSGPIFARSNADRRQQSQNVQRLFESNRGRDRRGGSSVYAKYRTMVLNMFSPGEQEKVFIPAPKAGFVTDEIRVVRIFDPPEFFGFKMSPVTVEAKAYGGEDPGMYGLPRWGSNANASGSNRRWWEDKYQGRD